MCLSGAVRLIYATSQSFGVSGMTWSYLYAKVRVKNIQPIKEVAVHYRAHGDAWHDAPLTWVRNEGASDIFLATSAPSCTEFVVRYVVGGRTYWDDNAGRSYHVAAFVNLAGGNVALNRATTMLAAMEASTACWIGGELYVNNLGFRKDVGVRCSADGGRTWERCPATYHGPIREGTYSPSMGAESWTFRTPATTLDPSSPPFQFAAYYTNLEDGCTYWDNDFGRNYTLPKAEGVTLG